MVGYSREIEFGYLWNDDTFGRFKRWMWEVSRGEPVIPRIHGWPRVTQFSIGLWRIWKYKFETILRSGEAAADGREWAIAALKYMQILEKQGLATETVPVCEVLTMALDVSTGKLQLN